MVKISNKPNMKGINDVAENSEYSANLISREGKLFAGVLATRYKGFAVGILLAVLLIIILPFIAKCCGL